MPRPRSHIQNLARLLDASTLPVYVLDGERRIVFCNAACAAWTGIGAEELLGHSCEYHSQPEAQGPVAVAAGLCPPPEVFAGARRTADVSCARADGGLVRRRAEFLPLGDGADGSAAVLAILAANDRADGDGPPDSAADPTSAELHEHVRRLRHRMASRYRLDGLLGTSAAMARARAQASLAAASQASVLIEGPPGSGKEHVAKAIHYWHGPQSSGTFVPLACPTLGVDLFCSTIEALARKNQAGAAERGTLLLNEIDELSAEAQAEVARCVGANGMPLRVMSTAKQSLKSLVAAGRFHADLACRVGTLLIELPSLAERLQDLPLLAQALLEDVNVRGGKQVSGFSHEALDLLAAYSWPGNLDELASMVQEAHERATNHEIGARDLPKRIHLSADAALHPPKPEQSIMLEEFLERVERELVERALRLAKGNKTKAAKLLGLTRARLYRRLEQWGLA